MLRILQVTLLLAALAMAFAMEKSNTGFETMVLQEVRECRETHCEVEYNDTFTGRKNSFYIVRGGSKVDPTNSCLTYHCEFIQNELRPVRTVTTCETIDNCSEDGKAPYKIHGHCCYKCEHLESMTRGYFVPDRLPGSSSSSNSSTNQQDSWGHWTRWTACSRECGKGRQSRMRDCIQKDKPFIKCDGERIQITECNTHECPIHGGWTEWTEWTDCSTTCDFGIQMRNRSCANPVPMFGGRDCEGHGLENKTCHLRHCPIDCKWEEWTMWTQCNVECGGGSQSRLRVMQVEKYGGQPCQGSAIDHRSCNTHFCPVHGGWTDWSSWTQCSVSCGNGTELRDRTCTNPVPDHGGLNCVGPDSQVQECFHRHCPVHCQWLEFSGWSACSLSCDQGTQHRSRSYVEALHGGDDCTGDLREIRFCNSQPCPDPCNDNGHPCFNQNVTCKKITDTRFECGACPRGMRGDGRGPNGCLLVNECTEASPCFPGTICHDLVEGYECSNCPPGFLGDSLRGYDIFDANGLIQMCTDVNECTATPNGGCHTRRECENSLGSYACGPCASGYVEDGPYDCRFSNPCAAGVHDCQKVDFCDNHAIGEFNCFCPFPLIGNGLQCSNDTDFDGIPDIQLTTGCDKSIKCYKDNCRFKSNARQEDADNDGIGDFCDDDADNDGIKDIYDNCKFISNRRQTDRDYDRHGDKCDNCPMVFNEDQMDTNADGVGDSCDTDRDGDGVINTADNCPLHHNSIQTDTDRDFWGDACDNCRKKSNSGQVDEDQDGVGNACDTDIDTDHDGIQQDIDNCPDFANNDQLDTDDTGEGDLCDDDDDGDGINDSFDNCPLVNNSQQVDLNDNGIGDACEMDIDGDGIMDELDSDGDGIYDAKDSNPYNKHVRQSSFTNSMEVNLCAGSCSIKPKWKVLSNGTEVRQNLNSDPSILIGYDTFTSLEYNGTFYVRTTRDDDYIGIVFNYQSNKRFMLISWKQRSQAYWKGSRPFGRAGIQIHMVDSSTGPGLDLTCAMWKSGDTNGQSEMLYHDPSNRGWRDRKPYSWNLRYSSTTACLRLLIYDESGLFLDSGCVCDDKIKGGRLGFYVFSQEKVNFSNIRYRSLGKTEESSLAQQCEITKK